MPTRPENPPNVDILAALIHDDPVKQERLGNAWTNLKVTMP